MEPILVEALQLIREILGNLNRGSPDRNYKPLFRLQEIIEELRQDSYLT